MNLVKNAVVTVKPVLITIKWEGTECHHYGISASSLIFHQVMSNTYIHKEIGNKQTVPISKSKQNR